VTQYWPRADRCRLFRNYEQNSAILRVVNWPISADVEERAKLTEPDRAGPARRSVIQARQGCPELARIRVPTGTCRASSGLESLF